MPVIKIRDPLAVQFANGDRASSPLPPPGRLYDGRDGEPGSALFEAQKQSTVVTLSGTVAVNDKTTITVTPKKTQAGSAWSEQLVPISVTFVATDTSLTTVAAGLVTALAAAQTVSNLADLSNYQRVQDIVLVSSTGAAITLVARDSGATFTVSISSELAAGGAGTVGSSQVTSNATPTKLHIGIVGVRVGYEANGTPKIAEPSASSLSSDILGVVMDGIGKAPQDPGYLLEHYVDGADAPYQDWGATMAYAEGPFTVDGDVYVRKLAPAGEQIGAVAAAATITAQEVITVTPTPSNSELFRLDITVVNLLDGETVASGYIEMTSDVDATAAEIVTGLQTSLDGPQASAIAPYIVDTGTVTLILTQLSGYSLTISTANSVGVLDPVVTQAAVVEHMLYPGAKFLQTGDAAGSAPISVSHP